MASGTPHFILRVKCPFLRPSLYNFYTGSVTSITLHTGPEFDLDRDVTDTIWWRTVLQSRRRYENRGSGPASQRDSGQS